jgi:hypothetical protein
MQMTTLPTDDTANKQQAIYRLIHACYPGDTNIIALPIWRASSATEPEWQTSRLEAHTGHQRTTQHASYDEAVEYWRWEWRLLDCNRFVEAMQMIDLPWFDDPPAPGADWFSSLTDMG